MAERGRGGRRGDGAAVEPGGGKEEFWGDGLAGFFAEAVGAVADAAEGGVDFGEGGWGGPGEGGGRSLAGAPVLGLAGQAGGRGGWVGEVAVVGGEDLMAEGLELVVVPSPGQGDRPDAAFRFEVQPEGLHG